MIKHSGINQSGVDDTNSKIYMKPSVIIDLTVIESEGSSKDESASKKVSSSSEADSFSKGNIGAMTPIQEESKENKSNTSNSKEP